MFFGIKSFASCNDHYNHVNNTNIVIVTVWLRMILIATILILMILIAAVLVRIILTVIVILKIILMVELTTESNNNIKITI